MPHYLCLLVGALLLTYVQPQRHEADLKSLLRDTDVNNHPPPYATSDDDFEVEFVYPKKSGEAEPSALTSFNPVKRVWGVPDTETHLGRMFLYPIPNDAFEGDVKFFQFLNLPSWLSFSEHRNVLEGVPGLNDVGIHYITVTAEGADGSSAKDAFAVQVNDIPASTFQKEARCSSKDDITVLSIILEKPITSLLPREKVQLIQIIAHMFLVKAKKISIIPLSVKVDPLSDNTVIMAGPGKLRPSHSGSSNQVQGQFKVQWSIGCGGEVHKEDQTVLNHVESAAKSGKLEKALNIPVTGWVVTQVDPSTKRAKRELESSGDNADYNDYEYDYEEYFNLNKGLDRNIPSLATPVFPGTVSTVTVGENLASPVLRPVPLATPVYVPVKPTRIVVEPSPTITDRVVEETDLESSLLTHPTTSADYTTPLTSVTSLKTHPTKNTASIEVTSVPEPSVTTEYAVKNFEPKIYNKIQKLGWVAGNVHRIRIPEDTFGDIEDGNTRNLTLVLKDENLLGFSRDSWIQFDPAKQEVYALPLEKHIGKYNFRIEAIDKERKSVMDFLHISVRQHSKARIFHHQFTAVLKMEKQHEYDFAYALDWQVKAVEKIATLFNDSVSNINVRNITTNPVQISWTNESLIDSKSTMCPTEELEAIAEVMLSGMGSEPSRLARQVFLPEFSLKKIHSHFYDPCEPHFYHGRSHSETHELPEEGAGEITAEENIDPNIKNQIDQLEAVVGHLFRYQVPETTCYDREDGDSRNLKLKLLTASLQLLPKTSWLQFDSANQEFFGLPLMEDVGQKEYFMECMDKGGKTDTDALIIEVKAEEQSSLKPVMFSLTIDASYRAFMSNAYDKARFMDRLGRAFGDSGPENIMVKNISEGSIKVEWYNSSLPNDPCPHEEVERLRRVMIDDNGRLLQSFKEAFLPDFSISEAGNVYPSGSCLAGDTPTHVEEHPVPEAEEKEVSPPRDEDYLLTFVVPAVIIAAMLLLAALVACCLYRRRRYGKMSMAGDRTFISKGIPIIFAEELDDHKPDSAKSPVIMKEEKPPLPPPEYQRNSPPRSDRQRPSSGDMNSSEDAPYHRPPPFTASNGGSRNQRPHLPPAYRKTPTYVPP